MQQKEIEIDKIKDLPIFFIVGSPRSGTTLLRTIFDAHPNVSIPLENPFFLTFYNKYFTKKYWDKSSLELLSDEILSLKHKDYWSFAKWKIDKKVLRENFLKMEGSWKFGDICKNLFLNFNSIFPKNEITLIGDKNPAYSFVIPKMFSVFPEARFIHIVRDLRDQILSMQKVDFGTSLTPLSAIRWKYCQKIIEKQKSIHPRHFYTVKYEELVSNTEEQIKKIFKYLNLEYIHELTNFHIHREKIIDTYKDDGIEIYHSSLLQPINTSKIEQWKNRMPEKEIKIAEMLAGRWAERYGYKLKNKKINPFLYFYIIPIYAHLALQKFIGLFVKMLPYKTRDRIIYKNSIFEKLYEKVYVKLRGLQAYKSNKKP